MKTKLSIISNILIVLLFVPIGWILGNVIAFVTISLLKYLGLDDNLYRFLDIIMLF